MILGDLNKGRSVWRGGWATEKRLSNIGGRFDFYIKVRVENKQLFIINKQNLSMSKRGKCSVYKACIDGAILAHLSN